MRIMDWIIKLSERVSLIELLVALGIVTMFWLFRKLFTKYFFAIVVQKLTRAEHAAMWLKGFERPLRIFFSVTGLYLAIKYLLPSPWSINISIDRLYRSASIILAGWGVYNVSASSSSVLEAISKRFGLDETSMMIPFLSKLIRFIVVVLIITLVGAEWGFSINGVVAGMGLGSLAVALAAKDTLGNIFGGVVIILEKPFSKGDWILTPDVEGMVEDITFRSTQIRTFADALVIVPNATLAAQPITNWSKMERRRVSFTLGVALDSDRERLQTAVTRIENMLIAHEAIHQKTIMVKFRDFNESSLGIFMYFFTKTTVWAEYLTVWQEINLAIMQILEEEGIKLAYPAQRVFLEEKSGQAGFQASRYEGD